MLRESSLRGARNPVGMTSEFLRIFLALVVSVWIVGSDAGRHDNLIARMINYFRRNREVCQTDACVEAARRILDSIDASVDPCDDFYSFACNRWIATHPIPSTSMQWSQFNELNEKLERSLRDMLSERIRKGDEKVVKAAKIVYGACMDEDRIEEKGVLPLLELLDEFGGWPLITPNWSEKDFRWEDMAAAVSRRIGVSPLLTVGVDVDLRNTTRNTIIIEQPELDIPSFLFTEFSAGFIQIYSTYLTRVVKLLRKAERLPAFSAAVHHRVMKLIEFEQHLTLITKRKEEMKDLDKFHNPVSVGRLQEWTNEKTLLYEGSELDWKRFLRRLLDKKEDDEEEVDIGDDTLVVVSDWGFLDKLLRLLSGSKPVVQADFMLWQVVKTMMRATTRKLRQIEFEFQREVSGVKQDVPRWQECVRAANEYMGFAVGYMYVQKHFGEEAKAKAIQMVENIRTEFRNELSDVKWIDDATKMAALEKADFMNHFIGYPDWYGNGTAFRHYYNGLRLGWEHFENILALRGFLVDKYFGKLDKRTSREEWYASPAVINAYYDPRMNSIIFPAGILEPPFFDKDQLEALNYGSIGSIIGHEITHAFDDVGRQADKLGNIHQWWTRETEETYLDKAKCFVEEYGKFTFPAFQTDAAAAAGAAADDKVRLNGVNTLGENIADNGGLTAALRAYLKHGNLSDDVRLPGLEEYSAKQLFYLGFAMMWCETTSEESLASEILDGAHSPHNVRVLGSLSNSAHFADTWGCRRGTNMNPSKKCQLW